MGAILSLKALPHSSNGQPQGFAPTNMPHSSNGQPQGFAPTNMPHSSNGQPQGFAPTNMPHSSNGQPQGFAPTNMPHSSNGQPQGLPLQICRNPISQSSPYSSAMRRRLGDGSTVASMGRVRWAKLMMAWPGANEVTRSHRGASMLPMERRRRDIVLASLMRCRM